MIGTYVRAAALAPLPRPSSLPSGPGAGTAVGEVVVDADRLAAFQRACGPHVGAPVPAAFVHVLAFPLQLSLMASRSFPLPLPGMVHVRQRLELDRPVAVGERLSVGVSADALRPHPRGRLVDLVAEAAVDGEPVWRGRSTYLSRGRGGGTPEAPEPADPPAPHHPRLEQHWRVAAGTGRAYARVSGDVNPIHLHPWAARALGFPRAIAHGMWTAARCLAELQRELPDAHAVDVVFRKPVLLPSRVTFAAAPRDGGGWAFAVTSGDDRTHLVGSAA